MDAAGRASASARVRGLASLALDLATAPVLDADLARVLLAHLAPLRASWTDSRSPTAAVRAELVDAAEALAGLEDPGRADARLTRDARARAIAEALLAVQEPAPEPWEREALVEAFTGTERVTHPLALDAREFADAPLDALVDAHRLVRVLAVARRIAADAPDLQEGAQRLLALDAEDLEALLVRAYVAEGTLPDIAPEPDAERLARRLALQRRLVRAGETLAGRTAVADVAAGIAGLARELCALPVVLAVAERPDALVLRGLDDLEGLTVRREPAAALAARVLAGRSTDHVDLDSAGLQVVDRQLLRRLDARGLVAVPLLDPEPVGALLAPAGADRDVLQALAVHASGWLASALDVARRLETAQAELVDRFEQRLREIVHEAKNPLAAIRNYLHLMSMKLDARDAGQAQFRLMADEVRETGQILESLLDEAAREIRPRVARASEPRPPVRRKDEGVELNDLVREVTALLVPDVPGGPAVDLDLSLDGRLPRLPVNGAQLRRVVMNLVKNALEAMPGGGRLRIATRGDVLLGDGPRAELRITDTAGGLPEAVRARLFEARGVSTKGAERGLGLYIVGQVVAELGGVIEVDSVAGQGTTFRILLPLA
jgi:signal transduction histidine kinase